MFPKLNNPNRLSWLVFAAVLTFWLLQTATTHESWNESTRLAAIESLVERGTWRIDASPYGHETGDKLLLDGHYYSDKPPLFAAIGALLYGPMRYGLNATLAIEGCQPGTWCVYYWLTVLMVGLPSALMAALFYRLAWRELGSPGWAVGLTLLLCLGTPVWPYSLVFNHHLPAAVALFICFYWLITPKQNRLRFFAAGVMAGLAVMLDLTAIFLAAAMSLIVFKYSHKNIGLFIGGALIPAVATLIFNYQITGDFWLPYFSGQGYYYPGSPWDTTVGGQHPPDNIPLYAFQSLIGPAGLLGYSPLLIFAGWGLLSRVRYKKQPLWLINVLILVGVSGQIIFVLTRTNNFGGDAYGQRFFLPLIPILYIFIIFVIPVYFYQKPAGWGIAALWGVAALVSVFSAYQGVRATWHQITPPVYLTTSTNFPYVAAQVNFKLSDYPPANHALNQPVRWFDPPPLRHPLKVNFNNELVLLGYDLPQRRVEPGKNLEITLYWQSLRVAGGDYFIFTHLLDANQTSLGGLDRRLQEGYPVRYWYPGEVVTDDRQIPVDVNAPNGLVWLRIGGYQALNGQTEPLPLLIPGQVITETSLALGPIFIGYPHQVVSPQNFAPQKMLSINLGQPPLIALRGYTLTDEAGQPLTNNPIHHTQLTLHNSPLKLTLYWQSLALTPIDWSTFVQLRNQAGQTVAQKDGPIGGGQYPTSLWQPGELIADEIFLSPDHLAQDQYSLYVGLYDLTTGQRLAVPESPANEILLLTWP